MWTKSFVIDSFLCTRSKGCFVTTFFALFFLVKIQCLLLFMGSIRHTFCVSFFLGRRRGKTAPLNASRQKPRRANASVRVLRSSSLSRVVVVLKKKRRREKSSSLSFLAITLESIFIRPTSNSNGRQPDADPKADGDHSWGSFTSSANTRATTPFARGGARARGGPVRAPVRHRARFTVRPSAMCLLTFDEIDRLECV